MAGTQIATTEQALPAVQAVPTAVPTVWNNAQLFEDTLRAANMLAKSALVPATYQNKPADCFIALDLANRMNVSPIMVMQNLYVVKGRPSWSGQACMALIEASGKFSAPTPVYFGTFGAMDYGCRISAVRLSDGKVVNGSSVTMQMAKDEGWLSNPKWQHMPEQMLAYRAASFFAKVHCPAILAGMQTAEEVEDIPLDEIPAAPEKPAQIRLDELA